MTPERFIEILDAAPGSQEAARSYSGRAMYGVSCVGVVVSGPGHGLVAAAMGLAETDAERAELAGLFAKTRTDSMGRGTILYWPVVSWPEAPDVR